MPNPELTISQDQHTMPYLDLTDGRVFDPKEVTQKPVSEIIEMIRRDTGRDLQFFDSSGNPYPRHEGIAIVKLPPPIGFSLFAIQPIKRLQRLCDYGGKIYDSEDDVPESHRNAAYSIRVIELDGKTATLDASEFGQLGTLAMHLPNDESVTEFGYSGDAEIATANIEIVTLLGTTSLYAGQDIEPGPIGFDYNLENYWGGLGLSPDYITPQGQIIHRNCFTFTNPLIRFVDVNTGDFLWKGFYSEYTRNGDEMIARLATDSPTLYYSSIWMLRACMQDNPHQQVFSVPARDITAEHERAVRLGKKTIFVPSSIYANSTSECGPFRDYLQFSEAGKDGKQHPSGYNISTLTLL